MMKRSENVCLHINQIENIPKIIKKSEKIIEILKDEKIHQNERIKSRFMCLECHILKKKNLVDSHKCKNNLFYDPSSDYVVCGKCLNKVHYENFKSNNKKQKIEKKEPAGLKNLGNTCFMNSVLQIFLSNKMFCENIERLKESNEKGTVFCETKSLVENMQMSSSSNPQSFWKVFTEENKIFGDYGQHDAQEFYNTFCNFLHEKSENKKNHTTCFCLPHKLFGGSFETTTFCAKCNDVFMEKKENFFEVSLPASNLNLLNMFSEFFQTEQLEGKKFCEFCKTEIMVEKEIRIKKYPKMLNLHVKLFTFDKQQPKKITGKVTFPEKFKFDEKTTYKLKGTVNHKGSFNYGHYISYVKKETIWYLCNDSSISKVSEQEVLSSSPYLIFYELQ